MMAAETLLFRISLRCSSLLMIIVLVCQYFFQISFASSCTPSSCGIIRNISRPFRLKDDPNHCGDRRAELACENNVTFVYLNSHKYYVKAINYGTDDNSIRVVDASINNDDTYSFPDSSTCYYNFTYHYPSIIYYEIRSYNGVSQSQPINLMSCPTPLKNSSLFTDITHDCASNNSSSLSRFTYIKVRSMKVSEVPQTCQIDLIVMTSWNKFMDWNSNSNVSLSEIHDALLYGFELTFCQYWCLSLELFRDYFLPSIVGILVCTVGLSCALVSPPVMTIIGFATILGLLYLAVPLIFSEAIGKDPPVTTTVPLQIIGIQIERNITTASTIREVNLLYRFVFFPKCFQQNMDTSSIMELTSLRLLDASDVGIKHLPSAIGNLKHLRYLNLSSSQIRTLPDSLCSLWNLKILNLNDCYRLVALPKNMRYLHNLRHLYLENCSSLSEMPSKIRELSGLKTLSMFVVGLNRGNQLEELQCLKLSGKLQIRHLERVKDHMDAKKANIAEKKNVRELSLSWERKGLSQLGEDFDEKVLEGLQPHNNLESLSISGFGGKYFPLWMTNSVLEKVIEIRIESCQNCLYLPKLAELPRLKYLWLRNLAVEYIIEDKIENGNPVEIPFMALERLHLIDLPNVKGFFKDQESKEAFPNLEELRIESCSSLILPPLSSLEKLKDLTCSSSTLALFSEQQNTLTRLTVIIEENMACFPIETVVKFTNLRSLTIDGAKVISVTGEGLQALKKLSNFGIQGCGTMRCLPEGLLQHLTALTSLHVSNFPEIVELPEEIKHLQNLMIIGLSFLPKMECLPEALQYLSSLQSLNLSWLREMESLPDWLGQHASLHTLYLQYCPKLVSLPPLPNLKYLHVNGCPELERRCQRGTGEDWHKIAHIRGLRIGC